jgi:hypothetical protein
MDAGSGSGRVRLRKTESAEMRWVASGGAFEEDEIESSDDGGGGDDNPTAASGSRGGGSGDDAYEEEEMLRQRLVRTGPRADSLDVEALDVPGMYRHQVRPPPYPFPSFLVETYIGFRCPRGVCCIAYVRPRGARARDRTIYCVIICDHVQLLTSCGILSLGSVGL